MRFLLDNVMMKALSLALAMLLWLVIAGETASEMGISVPVELQNVPRELELRGEPPNTVDLRLRASSTLIQGITPGQIYARIDLASMGEGEHILHLTEDAIVVPFGVKVVRIKPSIITLLLERTMHKTVAIRPRIVGRPAARHEIADVTADPAEVRIAGPKSRVQDVESAFTEPVSVEGADRTASHEVNLGLADPLLRLEGRPQVRVTARIREIQERRVFDGVAVEARGGTASFRPTTVQVVLSGPASAMRRVTSATVRPYIDVAKVPASGRMPVAVDLHPAQPGVTVEKLDPPHVIVRAARKKD